MDAVDKAAASELVAKCAALGVLLTASSSGRLRAVFYRGITDDDVERAARVIERVLE